MAVHDDAPGAGHGDPTYRLLLWSVRVAWASCALGVVAMTVGLVLRSPALVGVFRVGLVGSVVATGVALLFFLGLLASPARLAVVVAATPPASLRRRAETLLAVLLVDLLDPDEPDR
ncbi:hypothetical protein ACI78V_04625 [Geodermatophilus sp. SYSU D00742]